MLYRLTVCFEALTAHHLTMNSQSVYFTKSPRYRTVIHQYNIIALILNLLYQYTQNIVYCNTLMHHSNCPISTPSAYILEKSADVSLTVLFNIHSYIHYHCIMILKSIYPNCVSLHLYHSARENTNQCL